MFRKNVVLTIAAVSTPIDAVRIGNAMNPTHKISRGSLPSISAYEILDQGQWQLIGQDEAETIQARSRNAMETYGGLVKGVSLPDLVNGGARQCAIDYSRFVIYDERTGDFQKFRAPLDFWFQEHGKWVKMSDNASRSLTSQFFNEASDSKQAHFHIYKFDFKKMTQKNLNTGFERKIKLTLQEPKKSICSFYYKRCCSQRGRRTGGDSPSVCQVLLRE